MKFSHLSRNMTMQRHLKLYRLPEEIKVTFFKIIFLCIWCCYSVIFCNICASVYLYFVDAWHEEIPHRGLASGHRPAQRVFRWCTIFLVTTIDNIIVTQESLTWPQCTQTRTSNIGSCPRSKQILISNLKSRTHIDNVTLLSQQTLIGRSVLFMILMWI